MGIIDTAMQLASTQSDKIAKVIGKNPNEVKSALNQAQKLLPEIMNSRDGGLSVLKRMGVDTKFVDDMYRKYGSFAGKIPGMDKGTVENALNVLHNSLDNRNAPPTQSAPRQSTPAQGSSFDSSKYPRLK